MSVDSSGQQAVDFVWGNFPMQPNDDRAATVTNTGGSTGDYGWSQTTKVASARLNAALDNHVNAESGWAGYPAYTPAVGNFIVTEASGNGTTVTYKSFNELNPGDVVNITGLTVSSYNLSGVTVASANQQQFTVTNSANGGLITGQRGKVEATNATTAYDGAGSGNIIVPNVLGATTAVALDALQDAGYELANITTASAATNTAKTVTAAARASGSNLLVFTASGAGAAYGVGTKVTVSAFTGGDAVLNGTYTVVDNATNTFTVQTAATTAVSLSAQTASVVGVTGTIKTQSTAANAAGVATTATITITPWA
jgi:hypothetical protein